MFRKLTFIALIMMFFSGVSAQNSGSSSSGSSSGQQSGGSSGSQSGGTSSGGSSGGAVSSPVLNTQSTYQQILQQRIQQQMVNDSFAQLRMISEQAYNPAVDRRVIADINAIYRKSSKKDLATIAVSETDRAKYATILSEKNTGLIKLVPNSGCSEDNKVISASDQCLKYSVPGAGAAYSFRAKDYKIQRLADLVYTGETFKSDGVLTLGIMSHIGDLPLENITLQTPAIKYLVEFNPKLTAADASVVYKKLSKGFEEDGNTYGRSFKAVADTTYALRSIAYNGVVPRAVSNFPYNELIFDKRKDVIVVFRIVRKEADGSITVLWRELNREDSPVMKKSERIKEGFEVIETEKEKEKRKNENKKGDSKQ